MSAVMKEARLAKFARRKLINQIALVLSLAAMMFGLFWLFWILWETVRLGIGGINLATFSQMTPAPNEVGGLANAIYGSFFMVMLQPLWVPLSASWRVSIWPSTTPKDGWQKLRGL